MFVKRYGLFEDAVCDTAVILEMYNHAIDEIAIHGRACKDVAPKFAGMVAKFMMEKTLCIEKDCSHLMTGFENGRKEPVWYSLGRYDPKRTGDYSAVW